MGMGMGMEWEWKGNGNGMGSDLDLIMYALQYMNKLKEDIRTKDRVMKVMAEELESLRELKGRLDEQERARASEEGVMVSSTMKQMQETRYLTVRRKDGKEEGER
eukprot:TRINITY_DN1066_c0_g1_i1.p2 TRINITY_DN1066_c0_g1~~TRINITY_DN1066_c0_g1_i1.p2  ORF type:complete len:105 (-),score=31.84 TRINITY_DN1066_c0_g1_i1:342-656(-)